MGLLTPRGCWVLGCACVRFFAVGVVVPSPLPPFPLPRSVFRVSAGWPRPRWLFSLVVASVACVPGVAVFGCAFFPPVPAVAFFAPCPRSAFFVLCFLPFVRFGF